MKKLLPCVIGLGYVGLPVFISLKKKFRVIGFDLNKKRVNNLNKLKNTKDSNSKPKAKNPNKKRAGIPLSAPNSSVVTSDKSDD